MSGTDPAKIVKTLNDPKSDLVNPAQEPWILLNLNKMVL